MFSTLEDDQYSWGISAVPVRYIRSTREVYPQYPWGISAVRMRIFSIREEDHQYLWGYAVLVKGSWSIFHSIRFTHRFLISSHVLMIFTYGYCWYAWGMLMTYSWVLNILTSTADMPHEYCRYASWVLMICLTGTYDMPHGYWISARGTNVFSNCLCVTLHQTFMLFGNTRYTRKHTV